MALESHQEATDHWSDVDDDDDSDESIEELSDDSALDTEDEIEIDRKSKDPLKKERVFLLWSSIPQHVSINGIQSLWMKQFKKIKMKPEEKKRKKTDK